MIDGKKAQPIVLLALLLYVTLCPYFLIHQLEAKPLPQFLMEDYGCYTRALTRALHGGDPYADHSTSTGFIYPPQALLLVALFEAFHGLPLRFSIYAVLSLTALFGTILLTLRETGARVGDRWVAVALLLISAFTPVWWTLYVGQVNIIVAAAISAGFLLAKDRPVMAGAAIALGAAIKLTPILLLLLFLRRKFLRIHLAFLITSLALLVAAGVTFGLGPFITFVQVARDLSHEFPLGTTGSLSLVNSEYLVGLKFGIDILPWAPRLQQIHWLVLLALLGGIAWLMRATPRGRHLHFAVVAIGLTVVPNVVWYHHFVFALGAMAVLLLSTESPRWLRALTCATFGILQANVLIGGKFDKLTALPSLMCLLVGTAIALFQIARTNRPHQPSRVGDR